MNIEIREVIKSGDVLVYRDRYRDETHTGTVIDKNGTLLVSYTKGGWDWLATVLEKNEIIEVRRWGKPCFCLNPDLKKVQEDLEIVWTKVLELTVEEVSKRLGFPVKIVASLD